MGKKRSAFKEANNLGEVTEIITSYLAMYIKQIEEMFGDIEEPIRRAYASATQPMAEDMQNFMSKHHRSGRTISSFNPGSMVVENNGTLYRFKLGFDMKKGGFPALILEYGDSGSPMRMPNKAYFFMHWTKKNHEAKLEANMDKAFRDMLAELKGVE